MYKNKLCTLAIIGMLGIMSTTPTYAYAQNINTVSVSENKQGNDKKAPYKDKMKQARDKWNTLNENQKGEIYTLLEEEIKLEQQLLDKLVELGVMEKDDVTLFKIFMIEKYNKVKKSGEFPLYNQKGK